MKKKVDCPLCTSALSSTFGPMVAGLFGGGEREVQCDHCDGRGELPDGASCQNCGGDGRMTCPECGGDGYVDDADDDDD